MIESGEKMEEYREIKPYWEKRLACLFPMTVRGETYIPIIEEIEFFNGRHLGKQLPHFGRKFISAEIGEGKPELGAIPGMKYFIIKLGEKIS